MKSSRFIVTNSGCVLMLAFACFSAAFGDPSALPTENGPLEYLESSASKVHSFHAVWDDVTATQVNSGETVEARSRREVWVENGRYRYQTTGDRFDAESGKVKAIRQEYFDDGDKYTTFSYDFNGKGSRGAVVTASGSDPPSLKMLAAVLSLMPFEKLAGGIDKSNVEVSGQDRLGKAVLTERRANGSTRIYNCRRVDEKWLFETVEIVIGGRLRYRLTIHHAEESIDGVARPSRWILTKIGEGTSVVESTTGVVSAIEINRPVHDSILFRMPEGTAVSDATDTEPQFAYVGPVGKQIRMSRDEVNLSYVEILSSRARSLALYIATTAGITLIVAFMAWRVSRRFW